MEQNGYFARETGNRSAINLHFIFHLVIYEKSNKIK